MAAYGVTTVLDLRSKGETFKTPSPFADGDGVRYVHRELIDDANMTNIGDSQSMLDRYLFIINKRPHAFRDIFEVIAQTDGTVIFHCFAGKDRTGLIAAMLLSPPTMARPTSSWRPSTKPGLPKPQPTSARRSSTSSDVRPSAFSASSTICSRGGEGWRAIWRRPEWPPQTSTGSAQNCLNVLGWRGARRH